ncbi:MAG: type II secretion system secretin GspD [Candidatus Thiodiazotropha sp. (ex Lucinoma borealis)]|nr:type II secretion system secretin GspD [Candidatus Thiodiazotropha sp. (ex Lucinoma borealis)]MCU7867392.1 type II secretion system secretin GspD [Candidatus Thiodiazotropha sp. (ex Lucinoma borealis)]
MLKKKILVTLLASSLVGCTNWNNKTEDQGVVALKSAIPPGHLIPGQASEEPFKTGLDVIPIDQVEDSKVMEKPELFYGTGKFIASQKAKPAASTGAPVKGEITLNFEQADLREVIQTILGELLKESYILDPAVKGTVTIQTGKPLSQNDLLATLETLLQMNGAAMVEVDGVYRILPISAAIQGIKTPQLANARAPLPSGYALQIVPLDYLAASEMAEILKPLAPKGGIIRVDAARNLLVLAGTGREMETLLDTVDLFDVDWIKGLSVGFFPLKYAKSSTVIKELQSIIGTTDINPLQGMFRVVPIDEVNGVLVVTPQKRYLDTIAEWIPRLDRIDTQESGIAQRLFVYRVQNGDASDLAVLLQQLFSSTGSDTSSRSAKVAPGRKAVTQSTTEERGSESTPSPSAARLNIPGTGGESEQSEVRVVADDAHNSLVITATPAQYSNMLEALEKLDVRQLQVMVEATIIEVALQDELRYGLQWLFNSRVGNGYSGTGSLDSDKVAGLAGVIPGFNFSVIRSTSDVRAVLSALAEESLIRVLSSPSVMVLDNESAFIQVGDQVPVVTGQQQSTASENAAIINTISYKDTGVMLEVTPRVNPGGLVTMEVTQEVSDVSTVAASSVDSPTISTRKINSTVAVQNGEALILGGLITDRDDNGSTGLPYLNKLPVIGWLFGQESKFSKRTELVVVLVPRVVSNSSENSQVVESFRKKLEGLKGSF